MHSASYASGGAKNQNGDSMLGARACERVTVFGRCN